VDELLANMATLDDDTRQRVVGGNAREAYRLPVVAKLVATAQGR
jgi:hypothetical protein